MVQLDRRAFLLGGGAAVVLAACGGGDDDATAPDASPDGIDPVGAGDPADTGGAAEPGTPMFLLGTFPEGFRSPETIVAAGSAQRVAFVLRDDVDLMRGNAPDAVRIEIVMGDTVVADERYPAHRDGVITPYYPVVFTPPEPGDYEARLPDFPDALTVPFKVAPREEVSLVQVGDPMRPVDTPTFDDERGIERLCTRAVPCDFHELTLTEALESGKPTVLMISTPGFCQTEACGPVLDLLINALEGRDDVAVIHAEPWQNPSAFADGQFPDPTDVVNTYQLPFEPLLLVADADGTIVSRLDAVWDRAEMDDALALVL